MVVAEIVLSLSGEQKTLNSLGNLCDFVLMGLLQLQNLGFRFQKVLVFFKKRSFPSLWNSVGFVANVHNAMNINEWLICMHWLHLFPMGFRNGLGNPHQIKLEFGLFFAEGSQSSVSASSEMQQNQPQALHYALANAQQVQIHQIGEDGQVQVVCPQLFLNPSSPASQNSASAAVECLICKS